MRARISGFRNRGFWHFTLGSLFAWGGQARYCFGQRMQIHFKTFYTFYALAVVVGASVSTIDANGEGAEGDDAGGDIE